MNPLSFCLLRGAFVQKLFLFLQSCRDQGADSPPHPRTSPPHCGAYCQQCHTPHPPPSILLLLALFAAVGLFVSPSFALPDCNGPSDDQLNRVGLIVAPSEGGFSCGDIDGIDLSYGDSVVPLDPCADHQVASITEDGFVCVSLLSKLVQMCGTGNTTFFFAGANAAPVCRDTDTGETTAFTYQTELISQPNPFVNIPTCGEGRVLWFDEFTGTEGALHCSALQEILTGFCAANRHLDLSGDTLSCSDAVPDDPAQTPGVPFNISGAGAIPSITLSWSVDSRGSPVTSSEVRRWDSGSCAGSSSWETGVQGAGTSVTVPDLLAQTYHFRVRAQNVHGWGAWSACSPVSVSSVVPPVCDESEVNGCVSPAVAQNSLPSSNLCTGVQTGTKKIHTWTCGNGGLTSPPCSTTVGSCTAADQCGTVANTCASDTTPTNMRTVACPQGRTGTQTYLWSCGSLSCTVAGLCVSSYPVCDTSREKGCSVGTYKSGSYRENNCSSGSSGRSKWKCVYNGQSARCLRGSCSTTEQVCGTWTSGRECDLGELVAGSKRSTDCPCGGVVDSYSWQCELETKTENCVQDANSCPACPDPSDDQAPDAPTNITRTGGEHRGLSLSWDVNDNGSAITSSEIEVWLDTACTSTNSYVFDVTGAATSVAYASGDLTKEKQFWLPAQTLYVKVRAQNAGGWGAQSTCTELDNSRDICGDTAYTCDTGTLRVDNEWSPWESGGNSCETTGLRHRREWHCRQSDGSYEQCMAYHGSCPATPPAPACSSQFTTNHYAYLCEAGSKENTEMTTLSCAAGQTGSRTRYTWTCTGDANDESVDNCSKTLGVCTTLSPNAPTNIVRTGGEHRGLSLSWDVNDNGSAITASEVEVWLDTACTSTNSYVFDVTGAATSVTYEGQLWLPAQTLYVKVRAQNAGGWGAPSACTEIDNTRDICGDTPYTCDTGTLLVDNAWSPWQSGDNSCETAGLRYRAGWHCRQSDGSLEQCMAFHGACPATPPAPACSTQFTNNHYAYLCNAGSKGDTEMTTLSCATGQTGSQTRYTWTCTGDADDGSVDNCSKTLGVCTALPPVCNEDVTHGCTVGTVRTGPTSSLCPSHQGGSKQKYTWHCENSIGQSVGCTRIAGTPCINVCGSYFGTKCRNGYTYERQNGLWCSGSNTELETSRWRCNPPEGSESNRSVTCSYWWGNCGSAPTPSPRCGSEVNTCIEGALRDIADEECGPDFEEDTIKTYKWRCGTQSCSHPNPDGCIEELAQGCGTSVNSCNIQSGFSDLPDSGCPGNSGIKSSHNWRCGTELCSIPASPCPSSTPSTPSECGTSVNSCNIQSGFSDLPDSGCPGNSGIKSSHNWRCGTELCSIPASPCPSSTPSTPSECGTSINSCTNNGTASNTGSRQAVCSVPARPFPYPAGARDYSWDCPDESDCSYSDSRWCCRVSSPSNFISDCS